MGAVESITWGPAPFAEPDLTSFFLEDKTSLLSSTTNWIAIKQQKDPVNQTASHGDEPCNCGADKMETSIGRQLGPWLHPVGDRLHQMWSFYKNVRYHFLNIRAPQGLLQYEDNDGGRYSHGITTSWAPRV
jgi:hypothetical protein